jgi:hypothetical protein
MQGWQTSGEEKDPVPERKKCKISEGFKAMKLPIRSLLSSDLLRLTAGSKSGGSPTTCPRGFPEAGDHACRSITLECSNEWSKGCVLFKSSFERSGARHMSGSFDVQSAYRGAGRSHDDVCSLGHPTHSERHLSLERSNVCLKHGVWRTYLDA